MSLFLNERPLAEYRAQQCRRHMARRSLERAPGEGRTMQLIEHARLLEAQHVEYERRTGAGRRAEDALTILG
jgi:hypothetical protein